MKPAFSHALLSAAILLIGSIHRAQCADIVGSVVDSNRNGVAGVSVSAYRDSLLIVRDQTDKTGSYKLAVGTGQIDVIEFQKQGYHLTKVDELHDEYGKRNNSIIKLIRQNPSGSEDFSVRMGMLLTYESFYYYRTSPREPSVAVISAAAVELRKLYSPLVEKLTRAEEHWTAQQKRIYADTHKRVSSLYTASPL